MKYLLFIAVFLISYLHADWIKNVLDKHQSLMKKPPVGNWKHIESIDISKKNDVVIFHFKMNKMDSSINSKLAFMHNLYIKQEGQNPTQHKIEFK